VRIASRAASSSVSRSPGFSRRKAAIILADEPVASLDPAAALMKAASPCCALRRLGGPIPERALDVTAGAIRGVAYGVIGTAAIQAVLLAYGLAVAGAPGAGTLGFVTLLLAISQIGRPLLVLIWGGAAWWLFAQDQQVWGVFIIVWGVFVSTVDNFIKPWLIGFGVEMPISLTILGVFGGFLAFGFLGLFIGPTLTPSCLPCCRRGEPQSRISLPKRS
jgi:predicted PurR-regulated permease PerM